LWYSILPIDNVIGKTNEPKKIQCKIAGNAAIE
jgi:hypothetical protein